MDVNKYIQRITKLIGNREIREDISREYKAHIEDQMEAYIKRGLTKEEAEEKAIAEMGNPEEVAGQFGHLYRSPWDFKMYLYVLISGMVIFLMVYTYHMVLGEDETVPGFFLRGIGIAIVLFGFSWSAVEKYQDYDMFYAAAQNWGGHYLSNSGLMIAISGAFIARSWTQIMFYLIVCGAIQMLQRTWIARMRDTKESELLWELGTAETKITYKGVAVIKNKKMKVRTEQGMMIPKGDVIMVTTLDGFKPYVVSMTGSERVIPGSKSIYPDWVMDNEKIEEERRTLLKAKNK